MKKILTFIMTLVIALSVFSCSGGGAEKTEQTTSGTHNTNASSATDPVRPSLYPDKPEGLDERIRYECTDGGLYIVKGYFDGKGNPVEEHYYTVDSELGVLCCEIISYNSFDESGDLVFSEGHYVKNPYHSVKESVLTIKELDGVEYGYGVTDEYGNIRMYINVTEDARGRSVKEEYYGMSGRLIRTEETEYHANGNVSLHKSVSAGGKTLFICEYGEKGNFTKCVSYRNNGKVKSETSAEYHENGALSKYKVISYSESGGVSGTSVTEFFDDGRISSAPGRAYVYREDGSLSTVTKHLTDRYSYDGNGYLVEYNGRVNGQIGTSVNINYTYNESGVLVSVVSRSRQSEYNYSVKYTYSEDGTGKITRTNHYGIENLVIYTDERGRVIREETHNNVKRTKYYAYEYDSYDNIKKISFYNDDVISTATEYGYNEHGDLIRENTVNYYRYGVASTETVNHEYYGDGELKLTVKYNDEGYKTYEKEYFKDGGYMYIEYDFSGNASRAETFDKNGNNTRSVIEENGDTVTVNREFYENGEEKSEFFYRNGVLESGYEYDENGVTVKEHRTDENGDTIITQTVREGGRIVKINTWKNDVFTGYTEYSYFEFSPVTPVPVQKEISYDAQGNKIFYLERKFFFHPDGSTHSDCCVIKEEHYKDGVITAYKYSDYGFFYGHRFFVHTEEILADGELTVRSYSYELRPVENADDERVTVCREEKFIGGKRVSLVVFEIDTAGGKTHFIFDENENVIKKYYEHGNGDKGWYVLYTYHGNGKLKSEREYKSNGDILFSAEYDEAGNMTRKDTYEYTSTLELFKHIAYFYDNEGRVAHQTESGMSGEKQIYHTYDAAGRLIRSNTFEKGVLTQSDVCEYDERGNLIHEYNDRFASDGTSRRLNEFRYEYNEKDQLVKKVRVGWMNGEDSIDVYAYHENGKISFHGRYLGDRVIEEVYYDESGLITQPPSKT